MKLSLFKVMCVAACVALFGIQASAHDEALKREQLASQFITDMYNNSRYEDYDFLKAHCTPSMLEFLADNYDYDCDNGDCYAGWMFRTDAQDGKGEGEQANGVVAVGDVGDGWYEYIFFDEGFRGVTRLKLLFDGDSIMIDALQKVYDEAREIYSSQYSSQYEE